MTGAAERDQTRLWRSFSDAIGAELRQARSIRGASGIDHPVQAIAVDDKGGRVIVVSAEHNSRVAALMQGDIQASISSARVLVARPSAIDLSAIARSIFQGASAIIDVQTFKEKWAEFNGLSADEKQRSSLTSQYSAAFAPAFR